jgi:release factor glutamine methyltransferase
MDRAPVVGELLRVATERLRRSGSESARLDAELLLGHVLGVERAALLAEPEAAVRRAAATSFEAAIGRREAGEPVAYIRGRKEFYGLEFAVDRSVLIPRPETELLVDLAIARLEGRLFAGADQAPQLLAWDVGTGCGAIAVALAVEARRRGWAPLLRLLATDTSADAIVLAQANASAHGVADMVEFAVADLLEHPTDRPTDFLLANLPYIPSADVPRLPVAASFEPVAALDGGLDGLAVIRRLLARLPDVLATGGVALIEIGADQDDGLRTAVAAGMPGWQVDLHDDLGGEPRVVEIAYPVAAATGLPRSTRPSRHQPCPRGFSDR